MFYLSFSSAAEAIMWFCVGEQVLMWLIMFVLTCSTMTCCLCVSLFTLHRREVLQNVQWVHSVTQRNNLVLHIECSTCPSTCLHSVNGELRTFNINYNIKICTLLKYFGIISLYISTVLNFRDKSYTFPSITLTMTNSVTLYNKGFI